MQLLTSPVTTTLQHNINNKQKKTRTLYDARRVLDILHDVNEPSVWGDIYSQTHSSFSSKQREEFLSVQSHNQYHSL